MHNQNATDIAIPGQTIAQNLPSPTSPFSALLPSQGSPPSPPPTTASLVTNAEFIAAIF